MKREQLNDLFLALGQSLEPTQQNNGKASILNDTIKLLRALIAQVQNLRKEHFTLLNESKYVTQEKDELIEENNALAMEIEKLQTDMGDRMQSSLTLGANAIPSLSLPAPTPSAQQHPPLGPVLLIPVSQDPQFVSSMPSQSYEQTEVSPECASSTVMRPHARYPTAMDPWTFEVLTQQQRGVTEDCGPLLDGNNEEERRSSPKELELLH